MYAGMLTLAGVLTLILIRRANARRVNVGDYVVGDDD
jgi:hypothetical protein